METIFWIWMSAAIVLLIIELVTPTMIFASFSAAAFVSGIFSIFAPGAYYWQFGVFVALSVILLPVARRLAERITKAPPEVSGVDRMIGQTALVTKKINPDQGGQVRYEGELWAAHAEEEIEEKAKVTITSVAGTRVNVEKLN